MPPRKTMLIERWQKVSEKDIMGKEFYVWSNWLRLEWTYLSFLNWASISKIHGTKLEFEFLSVNKIFVDFWVAFNNGLWKFLCLLICLNSKDSMFYENNWLFFTLIVSGPWLLKKTQFLDIKKAKCCSQPYNLLYLA